MEAASGNDSTAHYLRLLWLRQRGPGNYPALPIQRNSRQKYYSGFFDPSVAQPPLPLHEFLPWQPLSLALQPPLPLHEFWPLQACFSLTFLSLFWSWPWSCALKEVFSDGSRVEALTAAPVPANNPANAAPASMAFVVFVIATSPVKIRMRCGTPCDTLCAS